MAVPTAYLTSTKNTANIFAAIQKASVPPNGFTHEFLKQLGFQSSGDRPIIPVLKAIGFLDESGRPTELYRLYKDPAQAKRALAKGIRIGYADLFAIDNDAHKKSVKDLAGMFARLSDKGDSVTAKMGSTFSALASLADFTGDVEPSDGVADNGGDSGGPFEGDLEDGGGGGDRNREGVGFGAAGTFALRHDIHVHLPLSTDVAVYDAIFKSLRENLM